MAESVDALVSNTSGATHPGSSPGLGTLMVQTAGEGLSEKDTPSLYVCQQSSALRTWLSAGTPLLLVIAIHDILVFGNHSPRLLVNLLPRHVLGKFLTEFRSKRSTQGDCAHFCPIEKVCMALGFRNIFNNVLARDITKMRAELVDFLGSRTTFFRYQSGEKPLNPFQQEWIRQLFRRYGYNNDFAFDNTKEVYIFD